MDDLDPPDEFEDRTPEERADEERKIAEAAETWQEKLDAGWQHQSDGRLTHPDDSDIWIMVDPLSHDVILSAKLVQRIREDLDRRKASGKR